MLAWTVRILALVALGLSGFLFATGLSSQATPGCGWSEFDCDAALGSVWSKWLGLPVALGGVLCYGAALTGALLAGRSGGAGRLGWRMLELAAPLAVGAGLWFTLIQATQLDAYCLWCLLTHATGLAMAGAAFAWRRRSASDGAGMAGIGLPGVGAHAGPSGPPPLGVPTMAGIAGVVALAVGQTIGAPSTVVQYEADLDQEFSFLSDESTGSDAPTEANRVGEAPEVSRAVTTAKPVTEAPRAEAPRAEAPRREREGSRPLSLLGGGLRIDAYRNAVIGSPEAPHVVVELMDYACPHCREFHDKVTEALERFDGRIALIVMPVPGEITCNKYVTKSRPKSAGACYAAKLSMIVAELAPERFERFHAWMLEADRIPSRTASLIEARRLVDPNALSRELADADRRHARRIQQHIAFSAALRERGRFGLPTQILGDRVAVGPVETVDKLCELWADAFGLAAPTAEIPF